MITHSALVAETDSLRKFALRLVGNKPDADDLLQATFVRVLEKASYFEDGTSERKWASKVMFNLFLTDYRRKKKFETQYDPEPYIQSLSVKQTQETSHELAIVGNALNRLSADHKEIIMMICVEDRSYQEVSDILKIPVGTVRSRLSRAREQLEIALNNPVAEERHENVPAYIAAYALKKAA